MLNKDKLSFVHCLSHWEATTPNAIWLTQPLSDGEVIDYTWHEAAEEISKIAHYLLSLNLPKNSKIALYGKNSAHWIMADIAIMMAGHIPVPIYFTANADTVQYVLEHSEVALLFIGKLNGVGDSWNECAQAIPDSLPKITLPISPLVDNAKSWEVLLTQNPRLRTADMPNIDPDSLASIIYTSGSTGRPKGVMHSHRTLVTTGMYYGNMFELTPDDRVLSYLPLAHSADRALAESAPLYWGSRVYFTQDSTTFIQDIQRARPTVFFSVPKIWIKFHQMLNQKLPPALAQLLQQANDSTVIPKETKDLIAKNLGLEHARFVITGSAPLPPDIIAWYRAIGMELLEVYAMTENFAYSHCTRQGQARVGYIGEACPDVICKTSADGEVLVKSPCNMLGYYKNPEKTKEELDEFGFLHTGDRGEIDEQGQLRLTGRIKDLFKTNTGKYVAPVPIEQILGNHMWIESVCVMGSDHHPKPIALIALSEDLLAKLKSEEIAPEAIEKELKVLFKETNAVLNHHEVLQSIVIVSEPWTVADGLLTPTLKIKRPALEALYASQIKNWMTQDKEIVWQ